MVANDSARGNAGGGTNDGCSSQGTGGAHGVSSWTLTLIEREDDTRSWGNFLVYFSHNVMPT
jgi:hypothetical protein